MPTRPRLTRLALAFIAGCIAATAIYAVLRVGQFLLFREPDPALVVYSAHAGYFWRCWISAYFGVSLAFATWLVRDLTRLTQWLAHGVFIAAGALALQSLCVP